MNTTQLECFLSVANTLNFARAAEELHITQPAVTHQINSLENELACRLFKRTTRSVELTSDGLSFLEDAQHILHSMRLAKSKLSTQSSDSIFPFSIGLHNSSELRMLPSILREFSAKYPQVHYGLKTLPFRSLENFLENGIIDVMFDFAIEGREKKANAFYPLMPVSIMCVLSPEHPLASRSIISPADLKDEMIILQEMRRVTPSLHALQRPLLDNHRPQDILLCESAEAAIALAASGIGVTLVPDLFPLRDTDLCYLPYTETLQLSYGIHYKKQLSPILKDFLEISGVAFSKMMNP